MSDLIDSMGRKVMPGDTVQFFMPGFCSGDYIYKAELSKAGEICFPGAPPKIVEGCRELKVCRRNREDEDRVIGT